MDPYLEHPSAWPNVHHRLMTAIADDLAPQLLPKYQVLIEERIYQIEGQDAILVGIPDVTIHQPNVKAYPEMGNLEMGNLEVGNLAVAASPMPISVTLPMPETIRQGYL
jgi:hypothetical protein